MMFDGVWGGLGWACKVKPYWAEGYPSWTSSYKKAWCGSWFKKKLKAGTLHKKECALPDTLILDSGALAVQGERVQNRVVKHESKRPTSAIFLVSSSQFGQLSFQAQHETMNHWRQSRELWYWTWFKRVEKCRLTARGAAWACRWGNCQRVTQEFPRGPTKRNPSGKKSSDPRFAINKKCALVGDVVNNVVTLNAILLK